MLELIIPLYFLYVKSWVCIPKLSFNDKQKQMCSKSQLAAMAAILNKKVTFLKISKFFQFVMVFKLVFLD